MQQEKQLMYALQKHSLIMKGCGYSILTQGRMLSCCSLKCDCHIFCISPVYNVFMRRQYYILPHGEVFIWNCVFSLYLAFFPGGWTLESQTSQWSKHQICDVIETNSSPNSSPFTIQLHLWVWLQLRWISKNHHPPGKPCILNELVGLHT